MRGGAHLSRVARRTTTPMQPPTFRTLPYGYDDPPHIDVTINFACLEWKYITRHFPIEDWINDLRHTREARLFAEGEFLRVTSEYNQYMRTYDIHHWYHPLWDHSAYEWIQDYTKPDSRPMQAYLALRKLEGTLCATVSDKYGCFSTTLSYLSERERVPHALPTMRFRLIPLYDFSYQVTYPGSNEGVPYRSDTWNDDIPFRDVLPHFDLYIDWMNLQSTVTDFDLPYQNFSTAANTLWSEEEEETTSFRLTNRFRWTTGNANVEEADETDGTEEDDEIDET
jgi:hypothetical protein